MKEIYLMCICTKKAGGLMGRKKKRCCVNHYPTHCYFSPNKHYKEENIINIDEIEAMRLVDYLEMSQIEAAEKLCVSRGSVQRLIYSGRKKLIDSIINGKGIVIDQIFDDEITKRKENKIMNLAFIMNQEKIGGHFGHAKNFKIIQIDDNFEIISEMDFIPTVSGGKAKSQWLYESNVNVLFATSVGEGAIKTLNAFQIKVIDGNDKNVSECIQSIKDNNYSLLEGHKHEGNHVCDCSN